MADSGPMHVDTCLTKADDRASAISAPCRVSWGLHSGAVVKNVSVSTALPTPLAANPLSSYHFPVVKNTFLDFPAAGGEEDTWILSELEPRRVQTDSVVEKSNGQLDNKQEPNIVSTSERDFGCIGAPGMGSLAPATVSTSALSEDPGVTASCPMSASVSSLDTYVPLTLRPLLSPGQSEPLALVTEPRDPGSSGNGDSRAMDHMPLLPASLLLDQAEVSPHDKNPISMAESVSASSALNNCTTVMVRHIPIKYTQQKFAHKINEAGFLGKYDFLYLPIDIRKQLNRGFAFINFESGDTAESFFVHFHGKKARNFERAKPLEVVRADIQGFEANAEHYLSALAIRRCKDQTSQPLFLRTLEGSGSGAASDCPEVGSFPAAVVPMVATGSVPLAEAQQQQPRRVHHQELLHDPIPPRFPSWQQAVPPQQQLPAVPRFCPFCGQPKHPQHSFCPFCGKRMPALS